MTNMCLKKFRSRNPDTVRFALISDVHIQDTAFTLDMALDAFNQIGNCDALLMLGDIIYQDGFEPESEKYDIVLNMLREKFKNVPFVYTIGNHEFPILAFSENIAASTELFEKKTGQSAKYHTKISGYHFITDVSVTSPDIEWIEDKVKEAVSEDKNKPVFVMLHDGFQNLILRSREYKKEWSYKLQEILRNYPQVIAIVGHVHITAQSPDVIAQDGFTVLQAPCLGEIGYIQGDGLCKEYFVPGTHQAMMIEIENNIVYVYKLDVENYEYIGEPFIIDIQKLIRGKSYYSENEKNNSSVPYFDNRAELKLRRIGENCIEIAFPKAYNEPANEFTQDGFVIAYKVEIFEKEASDCIFSDIVISDFYKVNNQEDISEMFFKKVEKLKNDTDYEAVVTPISPFRKHGKSLKKYFKI